LNIRFNVIAVDVDTDRPVILSAFEREDTANRFAELVKKQYSGTYRDIHVFSASAFLRGDTAEEAFEQFVTIEECIFNEGGSDWEDDWDFDTYPCGCCRCCGCDCDDYNDDDYYRCEVCGYDTCFCASEEDDV
jgi:hypothetical protein